MKARNRSNLYVLSRLQDVCSMPIYKVYFKKPCSRITQNNLADGLIIYHFPFVGSNKCTIFTLGINKNIRQLWIRFSLDGRRIAR